MTLFFGQSFILSVLDKKIGRHEATQYNERFDLHLLLVYDLVDDFLKTRVATLCHLLDPSIRQCVVD